MNSVASSFPVVSAGCDWLTMSAHSPGTVSAIFDWASEAFVREIDCGNELRTWGTHGFSGHRVGEIACASRGGRVLIILSGTAAKSHFGTVVGFADNVSRYDGQVTVRATDARDPIIAGALHALKGSLKRKGRNIRWEHRLSSDWGETVYLGSRLSSWYGRVYNKGAQSGLAEYQDCWRYEVELKKPNALPAARWVAAQASQADANTALVSYGYQHRGITPCFDAGSAAVDLAFSDPPTTDERRMTYLRKYIRPMVAKMLQRHTREELRRTLGLSEELYLREVYRDCGG
jgi:hypothetical protein